MYLSGLAKIVRSRVAREDQCPPGSTPVLDASGCVTAYQTGNCVVYNCYAPDEPLRAAPEPQGPSFNINVPTSVQTQVSPQISPVFVQQEHPTNSPVNASPSQVLETPQSTAQSQTLPRPDASAYNTPDNSEWMRYLDQQAAREQQLYDAITSKSQGAQPAAQVLPMPQSQPYQMEAASVAAPLESKAVIIAALIGAGALLISSQRSKRKR